jgi:hypothetical protein
MIRLTASSSARLTVAGVRDDEGGVLMGFDSFGE